MARQAIRWFLGGGGTEGVCHLHSSIPAKWSLDANSGCPLTQRMCAKGKPMPAFPGLPRPPIRGFSALQDIPSSNLSITQSAGLVRVDQLPNLGHIDRTLDGDRPGIEDRPNLARKGSSFCNEPSSAIGK
ncbi:hypothetical protein An12g07970 [Aspergillus niger]|uniref:Uncharacterized protein n=2 Tax=Aspergillus niger TaxID=5061 RepID=A2R0A9_ASPNC|nr:hypothetical protein An12g07970 [Aspergillus niger]CAK41247.1 hypothetical protein An12g07970 [Aspergillus niger]